MYQDLNIKCLFKNQREKKELDYFFLKNYENKTTCFKGQQTNALYKSMQTDSHPCKT